MKIFLHRETAEVLSFVHSSIAKQLPLLLVKGRSSCETVSERSRCTCVKGCAE